MSVQMMFEVTRSAISLQESEDGRLPSDSPDGPTTSPSGLEAPRVNLGALQETKTAKTTSGICGRSIETSLQRADRLSLLVNKLKAQSALVGLTGLKTTWKLKATPRGRSYWDHTASVPRISETVSIGLLPTPPHSEPADWSRPEVLARLDRGGRVARRICRLSSNARLHPDPVGLNHCFALAMMGYPPGWSGCVERVTRSNRKSPQPSSEPL